MSAEAARSALKAKRKIGHIRHCGSNGLSAVIYKKSRCGGEEIWWLVGGGGGEARTCIKDNSNPRVAYGRISFSRALKGGDVSQGVYNKLVQSRIPSYRVVEW